MALTHVVKTQQGRRTTDISSEVDLSLVLQLVEHSVDYVKTTNGAPAGAAIDGEKTLNTAEFKVYTRSGGLWGSGVGLTAGDRIIHKNAGSDSSGQNGVSAASNKIYAYSGGVLNEIAAVIGMRILVEDESNSLYQFITSWIQETSQGGSQGNLKYEQLTISVQNILPALTWTPITNSAAMLFYDAFLQRFGIDYIFSGKNGIWYSANAGFPLEIGDTLWVLYSSFEN